MLDVESTNSHGAFLAGLVLVSGALAGCVGSEWPDSNESESFTIEAPQEGLWKVTVALENGSTIERGLKVGYSLDQTADGAEHHMSVMDLWGPSFDGNIRWVMRHILDASGLQALVTLEGVAAWTYLVPPVVLTSSWPHEPFTYRHNAVVKADPSVVDPDEHRYGVPSNPTWFTLGPAVWGEFLSPDQTHTVPLQWPGLAGGEGVWDEVVLEVSLQDRVGECARVAFDVKQRYSAISTFCDSPLPDRVDVVFPANITVELDQVKTGGDLSSFPAPELREKPGPIGAVPNDGSDLSLPLEEAQDALELDPRSSAWLQDHPQAVTLRGTFHVHPEHCFEIMPSALCTDNFYRFDESYAEQVVQWNLSWWNPKGEWMKASITKPDLPAAPPLVTHVETGSGGRAHDRVVNKSVSLATILDAWQEAHGDQLLFSGVEYDLTSHRPGWLVHAKIEPIEERPLQPGLETAISFDPETGWAQSGVRAMRYLEEYFS